MPEPGWYPDPDKLGRARWWDGDRWTDARTSLPHDAGADKGATTPTPPAQPPLTKHGTSPSPTRRTGFLRWFSVHGRASRGEFWSALVVLLSWWFIFFVVDEVMFANAVPIETVEIVFVFLGLALVVILAGFVMTLARRLHDTGRPAGWVLLGVVPLGFIVLLFWALQKGDRLMNAYGAPPELPRPR